MTTLQEAGVDALLTAIEKMAEYEMTHPLSGGLAERFARVLIEAGGMRENDAIAAEYARLAQPDTEPGS